MSRLRRNRTGFGSVDPGDLPSAASVSLLSYESVLRDDLVVVVPTLASVPGIEPGRGRRGQTREFCKALVPHSERLGAVVKHLGLGPRSLQGFEGVAHVQVGARRLARLPFWCDIVIERN